MAGFAGVLRSVSSTASPPVQPAENNDTSSSENVNNGGDDRKSGESCFAEKSVDVSNLSAIIVQNKNELPEGLCSTGDQCSTIGVFENASGETAVLFWVNYEGGFIEYARLAPGLSHRQQTFTKHPWIAQSARTGKLLAFEGNHVFVRIEIYGQHCRIIPNRFDTVPCFAKAVMVELREGMKQFAGASTTDAVTNALKAFHSSLNRVEDAQVIFGGFDVRAFFQEVKATMQQDFTKDNIVSIGRSHKKNGLWSKDVAKTFGMVLKIINKVKV